MLHCKKSEIRKQRNITYISSACHFPLSDATITCPENTMKHRTYTKSMLVYGSLDYLHGFRCVPYCIQIRCSCSSTAIMRLQHTTSGQKLLSFQNKSLMSKIITFTKYLTVLLIKVI